MKILVLGAGVIGTTYAWQLSEAGHDITLLVRQGRKESVQKAGIRIRCTDQRKKQPAPVEVVFQPNVVDTLGAQDGYELIIVSVRAHQLDDVLPMLAAGAGKADILFFTNNWWGDRSIKRCLPESQYLFGLSRLVGGWRTEDHVECIIFGPTPGLATILGEKSGQPTPRLQRLTTLFRQAGLRPEVSRDILGYLATHYVEFLGAVGGILKAGSAEAFVQEKALVKAAVLATREGLDVCKARGINVSRAAPLNLRLFYLPAVLLTPLAQSSYKAPGIQQFLEENVAHGLAEIAGQFFDVLGEGKRLGVSTPNLESFERAYALAKDESPG
jgi:2-dehydropantoate 2-reductase